MVLKKTHSPSLEANKQDHLNDILMMICVLIAVISFKFGYYFLDSVFSFFIGIYILYNGFVVCYKNIDFLMGKTPSSKIIRKIKDLVLSLDKVKKVNLIKTQYLGTNIQVEIHIGVDKNLSLKESHDIGNKVRDKVLSIKKVSQCFVYIDPM